LGFIIDRTFREKGGKETGNCIKKEGDVNKSEYWIPGGDGSLHNPPAAIINPEDRWRIHWVALNRWCARLVQATKADNEISEDYLDYAHVFLMLCWHLGDWLIACNRMTRQELKDLTERNFELKVCRDIANGLKHLQLDRASVNGKLGLYRAYDHFGGEDGKGCEILAVSVYGIRNQKEKINADMLSLAEKLMTLWKNWLSERRLIPYGQPVEGAHNG